VELISGRITLRKMIRMESFILSFIKTKMGACREGGKQCLKFVKI
jgi:hypothetical protein